MAGASYDRYNAYVALPQIEADVKEVKKTFSTSSTSCPFPVGSVLLFNDATDPNTTWSGTTWEQIAGDRYLVGAGSSHTVGGTGGSNTHTLTTNELPSHSHTNNHGHTYTNPTVSGGSSSDGITGGAHSHSINTLVNAASGSAKRHLSTDSTATATSGVISSETHTHDLPDHSHTVSGGGVSDYSGSTGNAGSGTEFSIEPSYYTVCIWERTA